MSLRAWVSPISSGQSRGQSMSSQMRRVCTRRQIECCQTRRAELDGLPALQDRLDQIRAQKGKTNKPTDVAPGDAVTLGQRLQRPRALDWVEQRRMLAS
jgi:hypothetical protein